MNAISSVTTRGHRPRLGDLPRVPLATTRVDQATASQFAAWQDVLEIKQGVLTDRLAQFAISHGFLAWAKGKNKEAGSPSTAHPARPNPEKPHRAGSGAVVNRK